MDGFVLGVGVLPSPLPERQASSPSTSRKPVSSVAYVSMAYLCRAYILAIASAGNTTSPSMLKKPLTLPAGLQAAARSDKCA